MAETDAKTCQNIVVLLFTYGCTDFNIKISAI